MSEPGGLAVDPSRLESLRQVDPGLVTEIAALWLDTTPTLLAALREGTASADQKLIETAAHSLRGSSANLGADALAAACAAVEMALKRDAGSDLTALIENVIAEYGRAAVAFAELAGREN